MSGGWEAAAVASEANRKLARQSSEERRFGRLVLLVMAVMAVTIYAAWKVLS